MFHITIDNGKTEEHDVALTLDAAVAKARKAWDGGAFSATVAEYNDDGECVRTPWHRSK